MALGTIKKCLMELQLLSRWESEYQVDLVQRFHSGQLLKNFEMHSLRDFCKKGMSTISAMFSEANVIAINQTQRFVSRNTQYRRMSVIADYLRFLAITLNNKKIDKELYTSIEEMVRSLKILRPRQESRHKVELLDRALEQTTVELLHQVIQEFHPENPFEPNVRFRNAIIIELLSSLGLRKGELANIRLDDIDFQNNTLKVVRRPDESTDTRLHQPVVKTSERTLPISNKLSLYIQDYQLRYRGKIPAAKKHGYLFVSHKGATEGLPLSISGIDYIFKRLKLAVKDDTLSPHKLRHQWNYEFSLSVDNSVERLSEAQEEQMRSYLMGWSPTSGMAANYNRRRIVEKAHDAIKTHQNKLSKMKGPSNE